MSDKKDRYDRYKKVTIDAKGNVTVEVTEIKYNPDGSTTTIKIKQKYKSDDDNSNPSLASLRPNRPFFSGGNYIDSERSQ